MDLIDSHCHLDDDRLDLSRDEVVESARQAGVNRMILPATTANRWEKLKSLCKMVPGLYAAYGLHPMFIEQHQQIHLVELDEWLDREHPVAVGEFGLDFYHSRVDERWQKQLFREQLQLAQNHQLPVILHVRKAMDETIALLRKQPGEGGVVHSFAGSQQQAMQLYDLGFKLGIGATVGFERARKLRSVVASMPDDALLLESDAPDQPGAQHRGELNQPAFVVEHLKVIAALRETGLQEAAAMTTRNTENLFRLPAIRG
ncbi:MAG: TatD family hydrolase [Pseudomonadota bacterium]